MREVRAARVDEVYAREFVLEGDFLGPQVLANGDGVVGPAFNGAVVGDYEGLDSRDGAYASEDAAAGDLVFVEFMAGERGELEERGARVEERSYAAT